MTNRTKTTTMVPSPELIVDKLREALHQRLADIDTRILKLDADRAHAEQERIALQRVLEPAAFQMIVDSVLAEVTKSRMTLSLVEALNMIFDAHGPSMRWTDVLEKLVEIGIPVSSKALLEHMKQDPSFQDSGQGWWKRRPSRVAQRDFYGPMPMAARNRISGSFSPMCGNNNACGVPFVHARGGQEVQPA